ncbi:MAG: hypothetical protein LBG80_09200 [Bacteroidales bacterium]|jgi:hypothetical protein|nr:hypothetical protein [Bacteroidales bacterium]
MTKKISLILTLSVLFLSFTFGQNFDLTTKLSKKQMYKDFDTFVQIMDSSTHCFVRKIATGYDPVIAIKMKREEIKKIKSYGEFIQFLYYCLPSTMTTHVRMIGDYKGFYGIKYIDTQAVKPLMNAYIAYLNTLPNSVVGLGNGFYYQGGYYIYGTQRFINITTSDTVIISNYRVLKHNDEPINIFNKLQLMVGNASVRRWDYSLQQYYMVYGPYIPRTDRMTVEDYPSKKIVDIDMENYRRQIYTSSLPLSMWDTLPLEQSETMKVKYYDSLHLLYIYMGAMIYDEGVFAHSIKEAGKGKQIDKIIWDIRGNYGGDDFAWMSVLSAIIKNPLPRTASIGFRNTECMKKIFEDYIEQNSTPPKKISKQIISFLDSTEFLTVRFGGITEEGDTAYIMSDSNSLQYDGTIYVLQDEYTISSAGVLIAYCRDYSQLISVGIPTGLIAGKGITPAIFQLPESKFTFIMEPEVDLTNTKTAFDVFHDRPEIEIYPTFEELIEKNDYGVFFNQRGDEFLFKHDYLFKKVLKME